jgi:hypothetical protein
MLNKLALSICLGTFVTSSSMAATIAWGAGQDNGFSLSNGTELAVGNLVRLGHFSITDGQIQAFFSAGNIGALNSSFTEIAVAQIGDDFAVPSNFGKSSTPDTTAVAGLQLYFWAYHSSNNSSTANSIITALQMGIVYMDKAINPSWAAPAQNPVPGSTAIDLSDLTNALGTALVSGANIVVGSFPTGTSTATGAPNVGLASIVPEPTSAALIMVGLLSFAARRRQVN